MFPDKIYYEPKIFEYDLGLFLKDKYIDKEWLPIENHNNIPQLRQNENCEFANMKRHLIIGVRKTHRYVENHKVSDYLVPYTSSGCSAICLYCYLVCHFNKCSYMRIFANREQMMDKLLKTNDKSDKPLTFEIGSNSDLVLENTITDNLPWTINQFSKTKNGFITFPTKFDMVDPLLPLDHKGKVIFRMSFNPKEIIERAEFLTSGLDSRINALNQMCHAGYKVGFLIAPVVITPEYKKQYARLIDTLADTLSDKVKQTGFIEIIFMSYSFVHRIINAEAFSNAIRLYDPEIMTGRGIGKYSYRDSVRHEAGSFLREQVDKKLKMPILYIV